MSWSERSDESSEGCS